MSAAAKQSAIQQALLGFTLLICLALFMAPPNAPDETEARSHAAVSSPASVATLSYAPDGQRP